MSSPRNVDAQTRKDMVNELNYESETGKIYDSPLLNEQGREWYPSLLMDAVSNFDDRWLAEQLIAQNMVQASEPIGPEGTEVEVLRVMVERFTRQEFANLLARAVCRHAVESGQRYVELYRAEPFPNASLAIQQLVHTPAEAEDLLARLRRSRTLELALGLPEEPRSGLAVRAMQESSS